MLGLANICCYLSADIQWGLPNVCSANRIVNIRQKYRTHITFWNTIWLILGRMKQPLDHYVIVLDVRPFGRTSATLLGELLAALSYKYPYPSTFLTSFPMPLGCRCEFPKCCECFVSVCEVFACFETFVRRNSYGFVSRR